MSPDSLSTSLVERLSRGGVRFLGSTSGLSLEELVELGQQTGLCPPTFSGHARRMDLLVSADWGFLDFDRLGVDGAPSVDELEQRFQAMGLSFAVVYSNNHRKEKNGLDAERAHFFFPFDRPCDSPASFSATVSGLAERANVIAYVDRPSFTANQCLYPGSAIRGVVHGRQRVEVLDAPTAPATPREEMIGSSLSSSGAPGIASSKERSRTKTRAATVTSTRPTNCWESSSLTAREAIASGSAR